MKEMMSDTPTTIWDAEPENDPVAAAKSAEIDEWLRTEHAKQLSESCKTLILSPDGETFDAFRERVFNYLGDEVELSDSCVSLVATESVRKKGKKRLGGMEPSLLIYAVDPGAESDPVKLLENTRKALAHFLFTTKSMGLGKGCVVIVLVARKRLMIDATRTTHRDLWIRMFPMLQFGKGDVEKAITEEFEAAAKAHSNPLAVKFLFDNHGFQDISELRTIMKESHAAIIKSLGQVNLKPEEFHDAQSPVPSTAAAIRSDAEQEEKKKTLSFFTRWFNSLDPFRKERVINGLSQVIFSLEVVLLLFAIFVCVPWDTVLTFAIFLLESLGFRF